MSTEQILALALSAILLLTSAFFSGSEAAFFSLSPAWRRKLRNESAYGRRRRTGILIRDSLGLLSAIILANLIVNLWFSTRANRILEQLFGEVVNPVVQMLVVTGAATMALMIFGEVIPKLIGIRFPKRIVVLVTDTIWGIYWLLSPARKFLSRLHSGVDRMARRLLPPESSVLSEQEARTVARMGFDNRQLDAEEFQLISNIITFGKLEARHAMTPRVGIFALEETVTVSRAAFEIRRRKLKRVPLYRESIDRITGWIRLDDLLLAEDQPDRQVAELSREMLFVPETRSLTSLLSEFRAQRLNFAVVVDEFGGTAGVITLNDLTSRILGRIDRSEDAGGRYISAISGNRWIVPGETPLEEIESGLDLNLGDRESETIAGVILEELGDIPEPGTVVELQGLRFEVRSVRNNRIEQLIVDRAGD